MNRHFSKEDKQMVNRYMKKMLNIINHQGEANQNHMRYHPTPLRMAIIKNARDNKCWQRQYLCTVGRTAKWCSQYGKQYGVSSKNLKQNYHTIQQSHIYMGFISKGNENKILKRYLHTLVHCSVSHNSKKVTKI